MKYEVKFSCGHTEEVELFGKYADRERKLSWYRESAVCPNCYKAQKEAEKKAIKEQMNTFALPELTGSQKQIAWASDIRAKAFVNNKSIRKYFTFISKEASSKFWIESRNSLEEITLNRAAKAKKVEQTKKVSKSQIFSVAHKLTKQIKAKNPEVNYHAQFSICLKYAYEYLKSVIKAA